MSMDPGSVMSIVLSMPGNSNCSDCDEPCSADPWVSLSHGSVICLQCAGEHRALGVHISFVRSLALDTLKQREMEKLQHGGNQRLRDFLESGSNGVPRHVWLAMPIDMRYQTPVADLYRRRLQALVAGDELPNSFAKIRPPPPPPPARERAWTSDADTTACELCRSSFSLFQRRHHCRKCGRCICGDCAPLQSARPLPELGIMQPCRQCRLCVPPSAQPMPGMGNM
eukprot:CAMPEP_0183339052 /NCGR_PEP_ID=MMETSP0164_2-20130417/6121_1 /TAXON_ID=221442 /ORGANISM="Coccolithus pelagicus ssp braarudi, Strain PLY182g" /LENGTH=225 /DNA_ID=CAMNT_0025508997 /DNA_START=9 /DNA_END=686 /DNA_ORIENTATION=-